MNNQCIIVTGGGHGTGAALAKALAGAAYPVCLIDLNPDRAERIAEEIRAAGGQALGLQGDVANRFQVAAAIEAARDHFGGLAGLLHNAHVSPHDPALRMDEWNLRRVTEINLVGAYFCLQLVGRVLADEGGGKLVLLYRPELKAGHSAMHMTQMALPALAHAFDVELSGHDVRVLALPVGEDQSGLAAAVLSAFQG